ncbi:MAG: hypothetical protein KDD45_09310 [Bdellovibrionales bacterium]|nr:hypothetical protein [Bdellovibrionales bacterium]
MNYTACFGIIKNIKDPINSPIYSVPKNKKMSKKTSTSAKCIPHPIASSSTAPTKAASNCAIYASPLTATPQPPSSKTNTQAIKTSLPACSAASRLVISASKAGT